MQTEHTGKLFVHSRMPAWGVGLIVDEQPKRRSIQFQDGQTRTFRVGFYHLLDPWTGPSPDRADHVAASLEEAHGLIAAAEAQEGREVRISFHDQLRAFGKLFPEGFAGEKWKNAHRAPEGARRTKRHIDAVIVEAKDALAEPALRALLDAGDHAGVVEVLAALLSRTALASPSKDVKPLRAIAGEPLPKVAAALVDLLHGDEPYPDRLARWMLALHRAHVTPTWALAALPGALFDPMTHGFVRPRALTTEARLVGTSGAILTPSAASCRMAELTLRTVDERLRAEGLLPRDMLDVAHFVHETLRPKTITAMEAGEL